MPVGVPVTPADAVARIRQNNHEPMEPYPGRVTDPWKMRCMTCGHESLKPLSRASAVGGKNHSAFGCRPCSRIKSRKTCSVIFPSGNRCSEPIARHRGGKCNLCGLSPVKLSSRLCELTDPRTGKRCVAKHQSNGMCAPHKDRARKNGDPFYERESPYIISNEEATAVMKSRGLTPLEPYHGASDPWLCRCDTCGKESTPRYSSRNATFGCKYCGNARGGDALRFPAAEAVAVMESVGAIPLEPFVNVHKPWKCQCATCGRTFTVTFQAARSRSRKGNGAGCGYCSSFRVHPDEAAKMMKEAGFSPLEPYVRPGDPWKCRCDTCGNTTSPTYSRVRKGHGCRYCNGGPFSPSPTTFYLMRNPKLGALKVGITVEQSRSRRHNERRLRDHSKCGFITVKTWVFPSGEIAHKLEQEVLRHWREDLGSPRRGFLTKGDMHAGGHEETASTRKVGLKRTIDYIEALI